MRFAAVAAGAVAMGVGAIAVAAGRGLSVQVSVNLHDGFIPLAVLCVSLLVRFALGIRLDVAAFGLAADVMRRDMLPNAIVAYLVLANIARGVRCTLVALTSVACQTK